MKKLEPHPIALAFPPMSDEEFKGLVEDIRKNGQHARIVIYQGKILDGIHRAKVCEELGRKPHTQRFIGGHGLTAAAYAIGENLHRRHLTKKQKADTIVAVLKAEDLDFAKTAKSKQPPGKGRGKGKDKGMRGKATDIGKKQGIGKRTIDAAMARARGKKPKPKPKHETVEMNPTACELGLTGDSTITEIIALVKQKLVFEFDGYCFSVTKH